MKKNLFIAAIIFITMMGCVKTNLDEIITNTKNNTAPDYSLGFENAVTEKSCFVQSLNLQPGANAAAAYSVKGTTLQLRVGHTEPLPGLPSILFVTMEFPSFTKAEDIAGFYKFPEANQAVVFKMTQITGSDTLRRMLPDSGRVEIKYHTATKTLNGKFENIFFRQTLAGQSFMDKLSGKFKHVALEK